MATAGLSVLGSPGGGKRPACDVPALDAARHHPHTPQTEEARAEALQLMGVVNNLCTPKNETSWWQQPRIF